MNNNALIHQDNFLEEQLNTDQGVAAHPRQKQFILLKVLELSILAFDLNAAKNFQREIRMNLNNIIDKPF